MPGWTQDDIERRNFEIFGTQQAASPEVEKPAADVSESMIEAECCKLLSEDGWRTRRSTLRIADVGRCIGRSESRPRQEVNLS